MTFLSPNFLYALFSLPIPFIIHLWQRHRLKKIYFPSIMLLITAQRGQNAFKRLRDILLLFLRVLAILAIILGFANPIIKKEIKTVLVDNSYDMLTRCGKSNVFEKAKEIANKFKSRGMKIIYASGDSIPVCKYKKFYITPEKFDYVITKKGKVKYKNEKIIEIDYDKENFSIDSIDLYSFSFPVAYITNHTEKKEEINLEINFNDTIFNKKVILPPYTTISTSLPINTAGYGYIKISDEDALNIDNIFYFVYKPMEKISVRIIGDDCSFFVKNALSPKGINSKVKIKDNDSVDAIIIFYENQPKIHEKLHTLCIPKSGEICEKKLNIEIVDESHNIFNDFEFIDELKKINFTTRKKVNVGTAIATFSDGTPAITEVEPRNIIFSFPIDTSSKELILSPLLIPLLYKVIYYISGKPIEKNNFLVGDEVKIEVNEMKSYKCEAPDGIHYLLPKMFDKNLFLTIFPNAPGIYNIGKYKFAVNINNLMSEAYYPRKKSKENVNIQNYFFLFAIILLFLEIIFRRK